MGVTDKLIASIAQVKDKKQVAQELAQKISNHPHPCACAGCRAFDSLVNRKDTPEPTVTEALVESVTGKKAGYRVKKGDEEGHNKSKRKLPIDEKLAASLIGKPKKH